MRCLQSGDPSSFASLTPQGDRGVITHSDATLARRCPCRSCLQGNADQREAKVVLKAPCHPERSECAVKDLPESTWDAKQRVFVKHVACSRETLRRSLRFLLRVTGALSYIQTPRKRVDDRSGHTLSLLLERQCPSVGFPKNWAS